MQYTQDSCNSLIVKHLRRAGRPKSLVVSDLGRFWRLAYRATVSNAGKESK
jgi:hypothetical protein